MRAIGKNPHILTKILQTLTLSTLKLPDSVKIDTAKKKIENYFNNMT